MGAPRTADLPAAPRSGVPAGIRRRAAPAAITPPAIHMAALMAITVAPIMVLTMVAATTASPLPPLLFMPAVASRPASRSGRQQLRPPQHEATTIPITPRRPISGNEQADAVPPAAIQAEQLPSATKAA